jgi:C4-dicarboxylate transporter DctM subunit
MFYLPFLVLLIALVIGIPIAFSLAGAGILGIWIITGDWKMVFSTLAMMPFSSTAQYILTTIPMFIIMAYFSSSSGLATDLYTAASNWVSKIRGGLAIATVFACGIFGAMCGSAVACSTVMSNIAMPNMRRFGYSEELACGSIGVGAVLDTFIPPSVGMVIYGIATETSIGKLLVAGIIPGIIIGIFMILLIIIWVTIKPSHAPKAQTVPWTERWASLRGIWPSILLIIIILIFLYSGIATPAEVGAIGAFISLVIGISLRRLNLAGILDALMNTISTTGMIFMIFLGANIFGLFITLSGVPQQVIAFVTDMNINRWIVVSGIVVAYFVISMFMDEIPLLLLTLQITFPLIIALGFDPIWYGVLTMMMVSMGMVFPPVGINAFIVSAVTKVDLVKVYTGTSILMLAIVFTTILIIIFPQLAIWLPSTMR